MEKHLIAFDLDDTVVRKLNILSDHTEEVMKELQARGHYIMPASARMLSMMKWVVDRLDANGPAAMLNGAYVYDFKNERYVYEPRLISHGVFENVWDYLREEIGSENLLNLQIERMNYLETTNIAVSSPFYKEALRVTPHKEITLSDPCPEGEPGRITFYPKVELADKLTEFLNTQENCYAERVDWNGIPGDMNTRIYFRHARVDKWYAISETAEYLGVKPENIITFGDQWNDIKMLNECQNGYALKGSHAVKQTKRATEFTCEENGVAKELVRIFGL